MRACMHTASANVCNVVLMRHTELQDGISVLDDNGTVVGTSKLAARHVCGRAQINSGLVKSRPGAYGLSVLTTIPYRRPCWRRHWPEWCCLFQYSSSRRLPWPSLRGKTLRLNVELFSTDLTLVVNCTKSLWGKSFLFVLFFVFLLYHFENTVLISTL